MLVLLASVFNLLPVGFGVGLFVSNPPVRLLLTLGVTFTLTYGLTQLLRRRFLNLALSHDLVLRPTLRTPGHHTTSAVQQLTGHGFSPVETVVVATETGTTLTRPIVVMARHIDGYVAHANSIGATVMTFLDDETWLVTSTSPVVSHPTLRIQKVDKRNTGAAVEQHSDQLRRLIESGIGAAVQPGALDTVIHFERLEQETLATFRANGVDAPSAKALTSSGA